MGDRLEQAVRKHHRRRLDRLGHLHVLEPPPGAPLWVEGDPPPRAGNELDVLIDGERALPAIAEAIQGARSHVHIAGWHITPDFALVRGDRESRLRDLLAEVAEQADVRVLVWAGPPLPVFQPHRSEVRRAREDLITGTRIRCELDARERTMHCHHEKLVIVDDEVAFVGGIDLTSLSGDRFDSRDHPADGDLGWHDAATRLRGPAVADVAEHFRCRWQEIAEERLARPERPDPAGDVELQVVRTVPEKTYRFLPEGDFRILESYVRALRWPSRSSTSRTSSSGRRRSRRSSAQAARPAERRLPDRLPAPREPEQRRRHHRGQLGRLIEADDGTGRLLAATIHSHSGTESHSLYVHAKVAIVDDRWLTVGSANLNEHSLFNDTEMNVVTTDPELARRTRLELWSSTSSGRKWTASRRGLSTSCGSRSPTSSSSGARREALTHRLIRLPAVSRRSKRLIGPMRGLLVDAQAARSSTTTGMRRSPARSA